VARERRSDSPVHFLHRCDINHVRVLDQLTRVLKFMRDERKDLIVVDAVRVRCHEDADISVALSRVPSLMSWSVGPSVDRTRAGTSVAAGAGQVDAHELIAG
jgi:hypothetical protein